MTPLLRLLGWALAMVPFQALASDYAKKRSEMVVNVREMVEQNASETGVDSLDENVAAALGKVPRHEFVPASQKGSAYRNRPLPIGHGQTISQPFIVALMSQLLAIDKSAKVLEVGTGSGYQGAILAELARQVYSIEIVEELGRQAAETFGRLGYRNIETRIGDGYKGWPEHAPYDGILVTAAPEHIPQPLIDQLRPGGRLVIPVGGISQDLMVLTKQSDGTALHRTIVPVRFVPLVRGQEQE